MSLSCPPVLFGVLRSQQVTSLQSYHQYLVTISANASETTKAFRSLAGLAGDLYNSSTLFRKLAGLHLLDFVQVAVKVLHHVLVPFLKHL